MMKRETIIERERERHSGYMQRDGERPYNTESKSSENDVKT